MRGTDYRVGQINERASRGFQSPPPAREPPTDLGLFSLTRHRKWGAYVRWLVFITYPQTTPLSLSVDPIRLPTYDWLGIR